MNANIFLKRVLLLDAASCLGLGVVLLIGAASVSGVFGIEVSTLRMAGAILIPSGLVMVWTATRLPIRLLLVAAIILANAWWVAESLLLLRQWSGVTAIGRAFVIAQALAVAGLAALETVGVLRLRAPRAKV